MKLFHPRGEICSANRHERLVSNRQERFFNLAFSCLLTKPNVTVKLTRLNASKRSSRIKRKWGRRVNVKKVDNSTVRLLFKMKLFESFIVQNWIILIFFLTSGSCRDQNARKIQCSEAVNKDDSATQTCLQRIEIKRFRIKRKESRKVG